MPCACRIHMKKQILPPNFLVDAIALFLLLFSAAAQFVFHKIQIIPAPYTYLGIPIAILGLAMALSANALLRKNNTTLQTYQTPAKLVSAGLFQISRNPIYLGMAFILLGAGIFFGSVPALLSPAVFVIFLDWLVIPFEEKTLQKAFGKEYLKYKKRVRRWI